MPSSGSAGDEVARDGVEVGTCDWQPKFAAGPVPKSSDTTESQSERMSLTMDGATHPN
jgi:hypothetical protein